MARPLLRRVLTRIGGVIRDVAVGAPVASGERRTADAAPWAPYRKLIAVPVGAFLGWAATRTGWGWIIENQEEITALVIAYLVWRFPNAAPPTLPGIGR